MIDLPTLSLVIGSAVIDSINPFSIAALVLLLTMVLGRDNKDSAKRLLNFGLIYILSTFVVHLIVGSVLVLFFDAVDITLASQLALVIAVAVMLAAILDIKEYFYPGKGPSLVVPARLSDRIHDLSKQHMSLLGVAVLGTIVAGIELVYSGAPFVAVASVLRYDFGAWAYLLMGVYSLVLILPLVLIMTLVATGSKVSVITRWKEDNKVTMRLFRGLLMAILAWVLMLIANGTINFG